MKLLFPLALLSCISLRAAPPDSHAIPNRGPLAANAFNPLPLTSVKPEGWLLEQLRTQASGLSGHLDEFWPDVGANSGWLGGTGESWERGPYFLDGLVPLAYLLDDARLKSKVEKWMGWTLDHQRPDGAIGPEKNTDWWPNMVMLKALAQYQEATGDARVVPLMTRYFHYHLANADARPLKEWARFRWQDEVLSIIWLYNRTGDAQLLQLAQKLHQQGFDWEGQFAHFQLTGKVAKAAANLESHGVNHGQALKTAAVWSLVTGEKRDRDALYRQFDLLYRYHGLPNGIFAADEHLAGLNPTQGTELCTVVETMFSIEEVLAILGDPAFGDRLEKIAFNPLPGTISADMWSHQYDQQPNQIECSLSPREWTTNGPDSNLFGLEPNFGCCTANFHQGWPKLVENLWMATPDGGLALTVYGPSHVQTNLPTGPVEITEQTSYPFRDTVDLTINPSTASRFSLQLRIPAWATAATITVNGQAQSGMQPGTFYRIDRTWSKNDRVSIQFPMTVRATQWFNESVALERGPLVFSLRIGEDWRKLKQNTPLPLKSAEWALYPATAWNYALVVDPKNPATSVAVKELLIGQFPFSPDGAPVQLDVKARKLDQWAMDHEQAGTVPPSPVITAEPEETVQLIPYGSAKLRITAFPWTRR